MPLKTRRTPFDPQNPFRSQRPATSKIIFLSLEGCVTEEEYFDIISTLFSSIKSKIKIISVAEDAVRTHPKFRTPEQNRTLSKVRPKQLVERIDQFKSEKDNIYQFSAYPDDEFWIITDVDENWSDRLIDEWNDAISLCEEKGYRCAISNPFFEAWLLMHHTSPSDEDKTYAVTDEHPYEKTTHFSERLRELGVPIHSKSIKSEHYDIEKVKFAIGQASELHRDKTDLYPKYFSSTVYIILQKIMEMLPQQ